MPTKKKQLADLTDKMSKPGFWDSQEVAQGVVGQLSAIKSVVEPVEELQRGSRTWWNCASWRPTKGIRTS